MLFLNFVLKSNSKYDNIPRIKKLKELTRKKFENLHVDIFNVTDEWLDMNCPGWRDLATYKHSIEDPSFARYRLDELRFLAAMKLSEKDSVVYCDEDVFCSYKFLGEHLYENPRKFEIVGNPGTFFFCKKGNGRAFLPYLRIYSYLWKVDSLEMYSTCDCDFHYLLRTAYNPGDIVFEPKGIYHVSTNAAPGASLLLIDLKGVHDEDIYPKLSQFGGGSYFPAIISHSDAPEFLEYVKLQYPQQAQVHLPIDDAFKKFQGKQVIGVLCYD